MQCRAPTSAVTCAGGSPTGAKLDYDAERRLSHWQNAPTNPTVQAWYLYDGSGARVEQYVSGGSGNHTYYLPGGVEEVTPSGSLIKYYSAGGMTLGLNTARDASGISYLASDGLGSVSEALSPSGTATGAVLYSPYGGVRYASGTMPTSKGFTGQYADTASSGLDYYGARYYDPSLGQFTSADTVADGINRYGYVKGNPETFTDPAGHRIDCGVSMCGGHPGSTPPPPTCTNDATCGCYTSCGGGNGTGGGNTGCHGNQLCDPAPNQNVEPKQSTQEPPCDRICKARQDARNAANFWKWLGLGLAAVVALLLPIDLVAKDPLIDALMTALGLIAADAGFLAAIFQKQADEWTTAADWSPSQMAKAEVAVGAIIFVMSAAAVAVGLYITTIEDEPIEWNPIGAALDLARKAAVAQAAMWVGMIGGPAFIIASTITFVQEDQDLDAGQK